MRRGPWAFSGTSEKAGCDTHTVEFPSFLRGFHPPGVIHIRLTLIILDLRQREFEEIRKEIRALVLAIHAA